MTPPSGNTPSEKISPQFRMRLERLGPKEKVQAVILLGASSSKAPRQGRPSRAERQEAVEAKLQAAGEALTEVDAILRHFGGKRLSSEPNALGGISVETTAKGLAELAHCAKVNAILEDQSISLLATPKR